MNFKWSIAFTWFRSLDIAHLEKSIFALSRQTVKPDEFCFYDNNTRFTPEEIKSVVSQHMDVSKIKWVFDKHGDATKTATYCHNRLIEMLANDVFVLARGDLILDPTYCERVLEAQGGDLNNYSSAWMMQMGFHSEKGKPHSEVDHAADLEQLDWRSDVRNLLKNNEGSQLHKGPELDSAAFCMNRQAWKAVGGYNEKFTRWGFWQMQFQQELREIGVKFKIISEPLIFHMLHELVSEEGIRSLDRAIKDAEEVRNSKKA